MVMPKPREIFNSLPTRDDWFKIVNKADDAPAEIYLYDEIGYWGTTAAAFVQQLKDLDTDAINVFISSRGGDIFDGIAIYNALRSHGATITTQVDALAASIASVIVQAGDHRIMLTASQMMIHEAHGIAIGSAPDMRDYAAILDKQSDIIAGIYAERSGGSAEHFRDLMAAETWMDSTEAVEQGLADEGVKPESKADIDDDVGTKNGLDWSDFIASTELELEKI